MIANLFISWSVNMSAQQQERLKRHEQEVQRIDAYLSKVQDLATSIARDAGKIDHNRNVINTGIAPGDNKVHVDGVQAQLHDRNLINTAIMTEDDKAYVDGVQAQLERDVRLKTIELALLAVRMETEIYEAYLHRFEIIRELGKTKFLDANKAKWFAQRWKEICEDTYKIENDKP